METRLMTKQEREQIPVGSYIRDVEDGDFWYQGIWLGNDQYRIDAVVLNNKVYYKKEDDQWVGEIVSPKWYYIEILEND